MLIIAPHRLSSDVADSRQIRTRPSVGPETLTPKHPAGAGLAKWRSKQRTGLQRSTRSGQKARWAQQTPPRLNADLKHASCFMQNSLPGA